MANFRHQRPRPLLELRNITRRFPGVTALNDVTLSFYPGEVLTLLGENGAGKSTLIKIISGVQDPSEGQLILDGNQVALDSPRQALEHGIRTIHQEMNLVPGLPVYENICLEQRDQKFWVNHRAMKETARRGLERLGVSLDIERIVRGLPRSTQQLVEIAKGLAGEARLLILDEPTASLGEEEAERLMQVIRRLAEEGLSIVWITHRLYEVPIVSDRVAVLRDGELVASDLSPHEGSERFVQAMTGRDHKEMFPQRITNVGDSILTLDSVSNENLNSISMEVKAGEILGIAGLLGSGKSSLGRTIFGLEPITQGSLEIKGTPLTSLTPDKALRNGVVYYPSDRRHEGLALERPMYENLTMGTLKTAGLLWNKIILRKREYKTAESYAERMQLRPKNPDIRAGLFSGGNQQKILLSRGLLRDATLHIFDEPTVGIDVGARVEIYKLINELVNDGKSVIVISSDVQEVMGLSDRILVMANGKIAAEIADSDATDQDVVSHFFAEV